MSHKCVCKQINRKLGFGSLNILKVVIICKKLQHLGGVKVKPKKGRWEWLCDETLVAKQVDFGSITIEISPKQEFDSE
jgi:hypothetical protein